MIQHLRNKTNGTQVLNSPGKLKHKGTQGLPSLNVENKASAAESIKRKAEESKTESSEKMKISSSEKYQLRKRGRPPGIKNKRTIVHQPTSDELLLQNDDLAA